MQMRIGGTETGAMAGKVLDVRNPATGEIIESVPSGTGDDVGSAVDAAGDACGTWGKKTTA